MPIYEYICDNCGHDFDQFQHFDDEALTVCPQCHQEKLRKVYNSVGIVFKGKGFYANDHKSPSGMTSSHDNGAKPAASDTPAAVEAKASEASTKSESATTSAT